MLVDDKIRQQTITLNVMFNTQLHHTLLKYTLAVHSMHIIQAFYNKYNSKPHIIVVTIFNADEITSQNQMLL